MMILYGNPKVHKTVVNNTPKFQPILSAINTSTYLLAKYLNSILLPLTINEFTVNNFDFAKNFSNIMGGQNEKEAANFGQSNKWGGCNKQGGWQKLPKLINEEAGKNAAIRN